ncbi:MAG: GNAT family N-acetyltransferase [Acidimicrobiales bacterium]
MTGGRIVVRAAEPGDGPGIGRVHVEAWRVGYAGIVPAEHLDSLDAEQRGRAWTERLAHPTRPCTLHGTGGLVVVAIIEPDRTEPVPGQPVIAGIANYGSYRRDESDASDGTDSTGMCELRMLNVHPDHWGTGVAQALMSRIIADLGRERGEPMVALWVLEDNARGRRFYEKEGWSPDGARRAHRTGGVDLVVLRYVLPL